MIQELTFHRVIGQGGMGVVWLASHPVLGDVAAKFVVVKPARQASIVRALRTEVRATARMHHPGIVNIFSSGVTPPSVASLAQVAPNSPFMLMEYVHGKELGFAFPEPTTKYWDCILGLLEALSHVHARGVVHRDLKPSNILVTPDHQTLLLDLGVARVLDRDIMLATSDRVSGTPRYMSPEQILGRNRDQGPWTDLYAVGCMVYEALTGQTPYDAPSSVELMEMHLRAPVPRLSGVYSVELSTWLSRCLAKSPIDRYRFAAHALEDLSRMLLPPVSTGTSRVSLDSTIPFSSEPTERLAAPRRVGESMRTLVRQHELEFRSWRELEASDAPVVWTPELFPIRQFPVVGMERERDALWNALGRVLAGEPQVVGIEGPDGSGRSVLAEWLANSGHAMGAAVVMRVEFNVPSSANDGLLFAFSKLFQCGGLPIRRRQERLRDHLLLQGLDAPERRALSQDLAGFLGDSSETVPHLNAVLVNTLLVRTLEIITMEQPIVMLVDHPARSPNFLEWSRELRESSARVLLLAMGRTDGMRQDQTVLIRQATDERTTEIVAKTFGLCHEAAKTLVVQGEGNRFLMRQLLDDWVRRGLLAPGSAGVGFVGEVPRATYASWLHRFEGDSENWMAAYVAALLGVHVERSDFEQVCKRLQLVAYEVNLDDLCDAGLVRVSEGNIEWTHTILRSSYLERLREEPVYLRVAQACIEVLRASSRHQSKVRAGELLVDLSCANEALDTLLEGGAIAALVDPFRGLSEVADRLDLLVSSLGDRATECRAWSSLWRSIMARHRGQIEESRRWIQICRPLAETLGGEICARAWLQVGSITQTESVDVAIEAFGRSFEMAHDEALAMRALIGGVWARMTAGRMDTALAFLEEHEARAAALVESPALTARWHKCWAFLYSRTKDYTRAEARIRQALELVGDQDSGVQSASLLTDLGEIHRARQEYEEAILCFRNAKSRLGFMAQRGNDLAQLNIVMTLVQSGTWQAAARELECVRGGPDIDPLIMVIEATLEAMRGKLEPLEVLLVEFDPGPYIAADAAAVLRCLEPHLVEDLWQRLEKAIDTFSGS